MTGMAMPQRLTKKLGNRENWNIVKHRHKERNPSHIAPIYNHRSRGPRGSRGGETGSTGSSDLATGLISESW